MPTALLKKEAATHVADGGTIRQDHYGAARQPWDDICDSGWAPEFAAGSILKHLRRDKARQHSLQSAQWYYARLLEHGRGQVMPERYQQERDRRIYRGRAAAVWARLEDLLTPDEKALLKRN